MIDHLRSVKVYSKNSVECHIYIHQGSHATILDLIIEIKDGVFVYKLFNKRDAFSFEIVGMPFIDSIIPSNIFYGAIFSEILRIIIDAP